MKISWSFFKNNFRLKKVEKWITIFFFCASLFVVLLIIQALILTWFNQFKILYLYYSIFISLILTTVFFYFIKKDIRLLPRLTIPVLLVISFISLIFIAFPHDTFGGRDEGLFSNLAVHLADSGSLNFPPYLANETKGIRARLPAYTSWLAIQKLFFGDEWLLRSNIILVGLGLSALYLTSTILGGKMTGLITIILYASSMPFLWFSRETMTENLSFFLFWALVLFSLVFIKTKRLSYLVFLFLNSWVFSLTRVEGIFIQIFLMISLEFTLLYKKLFKLRKILWITLIFISLIISSFYVIKTFSFESYFQESVTAVKVNFLDSFSNQFNSNLNQIKDEIKLNERLPSFFLLMLIKYNFILIFFAIIFVVINTFFKRKHNINKVYLLTIVLIIAPEFSKLLNPGVTIDQPWLYRRYVYALLPFGYMCFSLLCKQLTNRRLKNLLFILVILINLLLSKNILFLKNNWSLKDKLEKISSNISPKDFVIVRNSVLGHYSPSSFLTIQKKAYNVSETTFPSLRISPEEKTIDDKTYKRLFLLSAEKNETYPNFSLQTIDKVNLKYTQLEFNCQLHLLGENLQLYDVYNLSFLPYKAAREYCSKPINEIKNIEKQLFLYELIYEK